MRYEADLDEHSENSELKDKDSTKPERLDLDLQNIRSVIGPDLAQTAVEQTSQANAEKAAQNLRSHAQTIHESFWKRSLRQWLVNSAASFVWRPDAPKILSFLLLLTLCVLEPGFVIFLLVMALLIALVLYFSFGPDQVQDWVISRYRSLRKRDPAAAERIRRRAAEASRRLSAIVEKLPERWTTGLYLPDFEEPAEPPEKFKSDPFERLANQ